MASSRRRAPTEGRALPLRARARSAAHTAGLSDAERAAHRERAAVLARHRRHRRLLQLGAACFPPPSTRFEESSTDCAITDAVRQSTTDSNTPPVGADRELHRTSAAVRRLLASRRGASALLEEAGALGQLQMVPDFALVPPRYPARPLSSVSVLEPVATYAL
ncbi:hypothetical protein MSPP1_002535 [Malassezia sp. CBS 17886]|nr:hypothetical protein MSPP1_002535 [Malassezia sp. CBS 17886]